MSALFTWEGFLGCCRGTVQQPDPAPGSSYREFPGVLPVCSCRWGLEENEEIRKWERVLILSNVRGKEPRIGVNAPSAALLLV